jgi:hypothetical protein
MLVVMSFMPSICFADRTSDSLLINMIWDFSRNYSEPVNGYEKNLYLRYTFGSQRRNPTLFLVPTMYTIAKGERDYIGESYCRIKYTTPSDYDLHRQVVCGTIPHNRFTMSTLVHYTTPNIYGVSIYPEGMLSPFHRSNRFFYKYRVLQSVGNQAIVRFRPRVNNTQLVKGSAVVNKQTGQVLSVSYEGEFDMISFTINTVMNENLGHQLLPARSTIDAKFAFLGNKVSARFSAIYDCPITLPDSLDELDNRELMDSLRPISLQQKEKMLYQRHDSIRHVSDSLRQVSDSIIANDTTSNQKNNRMKEILWDVIGDNLISSTHANAGAFSMNISPIINPQYFGYSKSRGFSYRLKFGLQYTWNSHRYLTFNPNFGYNFKLRQFYYTAPLRMNYNPKRNGYAEFCWANGNRISNGFLIEDIHERYGEDFEVPEFKDEYFSIINNVVAYDWLEITSGLVYHRRRSTNRGLMRELHFPEEYRSFAPSLTVHIMPWQKGPMLTANYERSILNVFKSNLKYARWEFDASQKIKLNTLRILNWRAGMGFYTNRNANYFVDFANFRDNNLPSGWEDDWSGQFQLLNSQWYNESNYYLRGHLSFESPLLALGWTPFVGHFIETERIYVSSLSIQHTRLYSEVGYGFTNRWFSTGIFASFLNTKFQELGCKFTIEIFERW